MTPEREGLSVIEKLDATHDVDSFACGKEPLDRFLKRFALANQKADGARPYVACRGSTVLACYSLAARAAEQADAQLLMIWRWNGSCAIFPDLLHRYMTTASPHLDETTRR